MEKFNIELSLEEITLLKIVLEHYIADDEYLMKRFPEIQEICLRSMDCCNDMLDKIHTVISEFDEK